MRSVFNFVKGKHSDCKGLVLMYHRIAEPVSDVWEISVTPANFSKQLQVLKNLKNVISLKELTEQMLQRKIKKDCIAITFDDGFADNILEAKPLLEQYQLPATFFINSYKTDKQLEFWWDELENIFLFTNNLPQHFSCTINKKVVEFNLEDEAVLTANSAHVHRSWKACSQAPPSLRCKLFYKVWEAMKPLLHEEQQMILQHIKSWAKINYRERNAYTCMSAEQIKQLSMSHLFDIAVHTDTHPALAYHDYLFQKQEITGNKIHLENIIEKQIDCLSYPYGNYNKTTIDVVTNAGFTAAFTTEEKLVSKNSNQFMLGRFQVKNWDSGVFENHIVKWLVSK